MPCIRSSFVSWFTLLDPCGHTMPVQPARSTNCTSRTRSSQSTSPVAVNGVLRMMNGPRSTFPSDDAAALRGWNLAAIATAPSVHRYSRLVIMVDLRPQTCVPGPVPSACVVRTFRSAVQASLKARTTLGESTRKKKRPATFMAGPTRPKDQGRRTKVDYLTVTLTSAFVQQHCSPPPPSPESSLTCARSMYSPGVLNVAVVEASITLLVSPPLNNLMESSANFTAADPRWTFHVTVTSGCGPVPRPNPPPPPPPRF